MGLTGRRDLFAREYLKDLNATKAAERAGYSRADCGKEGSRLLADEAVQAHIAALAAERNQELKIDAREVLLELHRIAQMDPAGLVNDDGSVRSLLDIPVDLRRTIASLEVEDLFAGRGEDRIQIGISTKVKFWNKNDALNSLGRHLALFKDVIEHQGLQPGVVVDPAVAAELAALLEEARRRRDVASDLV